MVWLILGFLVYYLVLLSERMLIGIAPHDIEQLRHAKSRKAERTLHLVIQSRASLAALLLARVFLKILITILSVQALVQAPAIRTALYSYAQRSGFSEVLVWTFAGIFFVLTLAAVFWSLKKIRWPSLHHSRARIGLQVLSVFIQIWKTLFSPFLPPGNPVGATERATEANHPLDAPVSMNPEKQRDIELLKSIVKFNDVTVKQVMQPRSKVVAVDFRTNFSELMQIVRESGFSRMPVYNEDLDNVVGILYVKDLVSRLNEPEDFEWQPLTRTNVQLVPEAKRASELLQEFKRNRRHMAIVVDEYGGSSGIVTMEDILEEITGEIRDEFDEESEIRYRKLDDNNYLFEGQTLLNDVCRIAGLNAGTFDTIRGPADTLAGLALELQGDIPNAGTKLQWENFLLTVLAANNRKIEQIKLTIL
ncbi:MAG: CBS domain-containing protein [Lewinellaceae bacterium]|nr:CBS domain-containing protein [Lewinellaceae bacterium]